jgi:hypothetical protein
MFDVNQITTTLRGMGDRALQQYAMMNKANPYILSLAVSESNQRKQLRTAAQARGMAPQPKVADAAIAGIAEAPPAVDAMGNVTGMASGGLPEDQGIARIPTPNIQRMADGGIAGYEDDEEGMATGGMGGMFNFAQQSEPVVRMSDGGHVPRYQGNIRDGSVVSSNPMYAIPGMAAVQPRAEFTQQGAPENTPFFQRIMESLSGVNKERQLAMIEQKIAQGTATPEEVAAYKEVKTKGGDKAAIDAKYPPQDAIRTKDFPGVKPGFEKMPVDAAAAPPPPPPGAKPAPQAKLPTGIATLKEPTAAEATAASDKFFDAAGLERRLDNQRLQERQDIANETEARSAKQAAFSKEQGPAMAGYAKLLDSDEKQDVTDKEKAGLMALFKGFLGIAAGESPNAAVNIAKGAMVGLEDYNSALKDLKKSAKERNKERAFIENAQRAESREDFKSQQLNEDKANDANRASERAFTSAITQITGKKGEIASGIYKDMLSTNEAFKRLMYSEAAQNARTNATLAAPDAQSKFYGGLGGGDPKKGLEFYAGIMGPEAKGEQALLAKYAGPQGEIALKMLETTPEGRLQAQLIRQKLAAAMLTPTSKPTGPVRD